MARNVLVTGSSHGIGAAVAIAFAKQGDNVGVVYNKTLDGAEKTAAACREYGVDVQIYKADLSVREECVKLMEQFLDHFKTIDVLINDAGGALQIPKGEFVDMPLDYWDSQIALNLNAAAYLTQGAIRNMKANNIQGRIVNISSVHATVSWVRRKMLPYCAAKAGIEMFTKAIAVEVAKYGIRVNCVAPGFIQTKLSDRYSERDVQGFKRKIAAGFLGQTEHIVPAILFLSDIKSTEYIVGRTLTVDGGQTVDGIIDCMLEDEF
ncbi:MAG: SDR family oxidoreductase [Oscillospiraceae bacterium]|nr:SDR family oxidoreductase [Oscillospiraceae bacterium]